MTQPRRDWSDANEKRGPCRNCGTERNVELAHVAGREYDEPHPTRAVLYVKPSRVIPLCGPATDFDTCHGKQHAHRLDLLPLLHLDEQVQAVQDLGGIERARIRLCPSAYDEKKVGVA